MRADDPILYAEDSDDDVFLLQRAFVRAQVTHPLVTVRDGRAAVDYLRSAQNAEKSALRRTRPLPGLVLLDLKMPHLSGLDVLKWIRAPDNQIAHLPVLMLSTSGANQDIQRSFAAGANGYLVKPSHPGELDTLVSGLKQALTHIETADWRNITGAKFPQQ
ncbi:MAG TPA: response regulator [Opitutaceae bacterium]